RAQAGHRGSDGKPYEAILRDGRLDDALGSESIEEVTTDAERATRPDILAHQHDRLVGCHLFAQRLVQRRAIADRAAHARAPADILARPAWRSPGDGGPAMPCPIHPSSGALSAYAPRSASPSA